MNGIQRSGQISIRRLVGKAFCRTRLLYCYVPILLLPAVIFSAELPDNGKDRIRTEQMLASILKSAPTGIGLVEGRVLVEVNDYILELTGYRREELIGQSARMLYPSAEDFEFVGREKYRQIAEKGTGSVETRWRRKDGSIREVILSSTPLDLSDLSAGVTFTVLDITERKRAEERFAKAFASNPGPLVLSEIDTGRFIDVNDSWVKMLGHTREEQLGRTSKEVGIWSDPGERDRVIATLKRQGFFRNEPIHFKTKDGKDRYAHWSGEIIMLDGREVLLSLLSDETERRQAEERFVKAFASNPGALIITEAESGKIIDANTRALDMFGYSADEMIGKTTLELAIWPNDDEREQRVRKFVDQGFLRDEPARLQAKDGRELFVRWSAETIDLGGRPAILSFVLDETAFKKAATTLANRTRWFIIGLALLSLALMALVARQIASLRELEEKTKELQASKEDLRVTFASIGDAVISTDTDGLVQRMNPVAEQLTGWTGEQAVGRPLREVFRIVNAQGEEAESPVERVMATGEIVGLANHTVLLSRDGTRYHIADSGAPIRTADSTIIGVVLVFRDVTGEYALQERLRHSQKMDAIGQLAGGIAHDFNNMLSGILGGTELLKMRLPQDQATAKYLGMIEHSVQRAADLTEKLLSFARRQPVTEVPVDIHRSISAAVDILGNTIDRRIRIEFDPETSSPLVLGDATMLQNVFLNLGINASHAMPDGGLLRITTRLIDLGETDCLAAGSSLTPGRYIQIEIRDTGCGIPAENLQRIFEPFFTTKPQGMGTGLGLAAALGTIQQHRGTITVYSEQGVGTTFRILLPLTGQQAEPEPAPALTAVVGSGLILLVDDEEVIRDGGSAILKQAGYHVLTAEDGAAALNVFREHRHDIDLVILDMIMPNMNGRDCFYALRAINPALPVILSSGYSRENDLRDMQANGLSGFIQKPFQAAALTRMIAAVLTGAEETGGDE